MEIKLLKQGYSNNIKLYEDFINNTLDFEEEYFSNTTINLENTPDFPIYINTRDEEKRMKEFKEAVKVIRNFYINLPREIHLDSLFWHSLLIYKRDYIMEKYGEQINSFAKFKNIVLKKLDWENYIYKCLLIAEYAYDGVDDQEQSEKYIEYIVENLDLYNYIIKYTLFRNREFIIRFFESIHQLGIKDILKKKVINRPELGNDVRYGRLIFQELNNAYPVIMSPLLDSEDLKKEILTALSNYMDISEFSSHN